MTLPRNFIAPAVDGRGEVHLQLANDTVCSITVTAIVDGQPRRQVRFGTWRQREAELEFEFDGAIARYEWLPDGINGGEGPYCMLPQLAPRFRDAVGPLPAAPLLERSAWSAANAPAATPRGPYARLLHAMFRVTKRLPWWSRAPVITATVLVAVVLVRAVLSIPSARELAEIGTGLGRVAIAGLVAGAVPTLLWLPLRRLGYVGSLLLGVAGMTAYLWTCAWAFGHLTMATDGPLLFYGMSAGYGLLVGHVIIHRVVSAGRSNGAPHPPGPQPQQPVPR